MRKDGSVSFRCCDFCDKPIKSDVGIYVMRNKLFTEGSEPFVAKDYTGKVQKPEGQDVVVQKMMNNLVLCLH